MKIRTSHNETRHPEDTNNEVTSMLRLSDRDTLGNRVNNQRMSETLREQKIKLI